MTEPKVIILDTETTGFLKPQVLEYAHIVLNELTDYSGITLTSNTHTTYTDRFDVTKPIDYGASQIHGIYKNDIKGLPVFAFGSMPVPDSVEYMVGHNISYDHRAMGKASTLKRICTLKLAKALWPGLESYKLVALMVQFFPEEYEQIVKDAHGAMVDCKLCLVLITKAKLEFEFETWEDIYEIAGQG